jgi:uncharacterized protein (TIGR03000 family)
VGALVAQTDPPIAPPDKTILIVRVPADATVTIGGQSMAQKGPQRSFITPALEPGTTYSFELIARWQDADHEKSVKRTVTFRAGQAKIVDFRRLEPDDTIEPRPERVARSNPEKKVEPEKKTEHEKAEPKKSSEPEKKTEPEKKAEPKTKTEPEKKAEPEKKTEPKTKTEPEKKAELEKKTEPKTKTEPEKNTEPKKSVGGTPNTKAKSFLFTYAARIKDLPPATRAKVWVPIASSNGQQVVTIVEQLLGDAQIKHDKQYGNAIAYFEAKANAKGVIPFEVTYKVARKEVPADIPGSAFAGEKIDRYLQPDARVPISGKPLELLQARLKEPLPSDPSVAARAMYDVVNQTLTYKKAGTGVGQGDALMAAEARVGNSADFASLFISMARGHKIPAKFEIGFVVPPKPGPVTDYQAWAWFLAGSKGWIPVDIAEANQHPELAAYYFGSLSANRISFSVGRDIELEPRQKGPPRNFFVYPYVEVDGKEYPADKISLSLSSKDAQ